MKLRVNLIKLAVNNKKGQATVEYILLIASMVMVLNVGVKHLRDIFYGWDGNEGALQLIFEGQVSFLENRKW